jgi:phage protein D
MDVPADSVELTLGVDDNTKKVKEGDPVSVKLGYEDGLKNVFVGEVDNVVPELVHIKVLGLNLASKLLKQRVNKTYEKQAAGKIVSDLAQTLKIQTDTVSDGVTFPYYVVDDGRNLHEHMKELAELCGFDVYLTNENKLVFKKYEKKDKHTLEYGKNVIEIEFDEDRPPIGAVTVQGESPSSFKGADTSHWLTKRAVEGVKGDGAKKLIIEPAVKDKETAEKVADAVQAQSQRTVNGYVKSVGDPDVKLGDAVEIKGMSNAKMNGEFQVRAVEHYLSKTAGFTTSIWWRK